MNKSKKHWYLLALLAFLLPSQSLAVDVDILMVYTSTARASVGGEAAMHNEINSMVHEVNIVLSNSRVENRLRLVGRLEVQYNESTITSANLNRLATDGDVSAERDRVGADLVCLITSQGDNNGMGYPYGSGEQGGFCTIKLYPDYAILGMTRGFLMAHEVGHLFGCDHNDDGILAPGSGTGQGYQYWVDLIPYGTVMAYPSPSILLHKFVWYYSNPDVLHYSIWGYGVPMGVEGEHDCAGMVESTAGTVADYRATPTPSDTVWVDTTLSNNGNGTQFLPFNSVQAGIDNVQEGGKLIFTQGTDGWQASHQWQGTISKAMTISADGGVMVIGR